MMFMAIKEQTTTRGGQTQRFQVPTHAFRSFGTSPWAMMDALSSILFPTRASRHALPDSASARVKRVKGFIFLYYSTTACHYLLIFILSLGAFFPSAISPGMSSCGGEVSTLPLCSCHCYPIFAKTTQWLPIDMSVGYMSYLMVIPRVQVCYSK